MRKRLDGRNLLLPGMRVGVDEGPLPGRWSHSEPECKGRGVNKLVLYLTEDNGLKEEKERGRRLGALAELKLRWIELSPTN